MIIFRLLTGDVTNTIELGEAVFAAIEPLCAPGFGMDVAIISTNRDIDAIKIHMQFRQCEIGEYYVDRICLPCRNGSYSFTDPAGLSLSELREVNVCHNCPSGVTSCYASTLNLDKGHWRISTNAESILSCPMDVESCVGGTEAGNALCSNGHEVMVYVSHFLLEYCIIVLSWLTGAIVCRL